MKDSFDGPHTHKYVVRELPKFNKVRSHPDYYMVEENIHVIKNFLSESECDWFQKIIQESDEDRWEGNSEGEGRSWWFKRIINLNKDQMESDIVSNIVKKIRLYIDDEEPNLIIRNELSAIHRMPPGDSMFVHCDNPIYEEYDITDKEIENVNLGLQYAVILYLSDFEGGEVYYPYLGIEYKPKKGDALWHPGNKKYTHGVKKVTGDKTRYITTTYFTDREIREKNNDIVGWKHLNH